MTDPLSFFVQGHPQTQGGMRQVQDKRGNHHLITTGSKDLKPWRTKIEHTARLAANLAYWETLIDCPVAVTLRFFIPMPGDRPAGRRRLRIWWAVKKHDIDKLQRAVLDSLTRAEIYKDDGQIAKSLLEKWELVDERYCGVEVTVREIDYTDPYTLELMVGHRDRRELSPASLQPQGLGQRPNKK